MTQIPPETPKGGQAQVPLGQPVVWTDEQLDALSQISDADLLLAIELWKRNNPISGLRDLLDADLDTQGQGGGPNVGRF